MKKSKLEMEDDLLSEYDLKILIVRKFGSGRKSFSETIDLLQKS